MNTREGTFNLNYSLSVKLKLKLLGCMCIGHVDITMAWCCPNIFSWLKPRTKKKKRKGFALLPWPLVAKTLTPTAPLPVSNAWQSTFFVVWLISLALPWVAHMASELPPKSECLFCLSVCMCECGVLGRIGGVFMLSKARLCLLSQLLNQNYSRVYIPGKSCHFTAPVAYCASMAICGIDG